MTPLAHQLLLRRQLVARSQARHHRPRPVPRPSLPRGPALAYTSDVLAWLAALEQAIEATLRESGLVLPGPEPLPSQIVRARIKVRAMAPHLVDPHGILAMLDRIARGVEDFAREDLRRQLTAVLGVTVSLPAAAGPRINQPLDTFRQETLAMLRALAAERCADVEAALDPEGAPGASFDRTALEALLRADADALARRAVRLGRERVFLLAAELVEALQTACGITGYIWRTCGDDRVRPGHAALDGQACLWSTPPVVDPASGRRAHPGRDWNCRCGAEPILEGAES